MNHKEAVNAVTTSGSIGLEVYYVPDSSTKHDSSEESRSREAERRNHGGSGTEHVFSTISFKRVDDDSKKGGTKDEKTEISNRTDDYREVLQDRNEEAEGLRGERHRRRRQRPRRRSQPIGVNGGTRIHRDRTASGC